MKSRNPGRSNERIRRTAVRGRSRRLAALASWLVLPAALVMALPGTAPAGEGAVEINQAVVDAGGGFPYTISLPGSYRLTGSLMVPDAATTAISITANDVTLDLGGFTIQGVTTCTGQPANCSNFGAGNGITLTGVGTTIRNGHVRGMGDAGIQDNSSSVESKTLIVGVKAIGNGSHGIQAEEGPAVVRDCVASTNGGAGIKAGPGSVVRGNTAEANGSSGFTTRAGASVVDNNVAVGNGSIGFDLNGPGAVVRGNTARGNGGDGFEINTDSMVTGNAASENTGFGMDLGAGTGYTQNSVNGNTGGTVNGGIDAGSNVCDNALGCP